MNPVRFLKSVWSAEHKNWQENPPTGSDHRRSIIILVWTAIGLSLAYYLGNPEKVVEFLHVCNLYSISAPFSDYMMHGPDWQLHTLTWWAGVLITVYLIVPVFITKFLFRMRLSEMGLTFTGTWNGWKIYVLMLAVMIPLVYLMSGTESFQQRYPFYRCGSGGPICVNFWKWQCMYLLQFIALEFFYRGFITLGTRKSFGFMSIFVMAIPYCMIHFGKPMPETIAAIIAGIVLGTLSMKSRSVLLGVVIHYSVAITMDIMAIYRAKL